MSPYNLQGSADVFPRCPASNDSYLYTGIQEIFTKNDEFLSLFLFHDTSAYSTIEPRFHS